MPRGRAGLDLVKPERVREVFKKFYSWRTGPTYVAGLWNVNERTVRRWLKTGLPLCYGAVWITRDEWREFERTGQVPKSRVDAQPIRRRRDPPPKRAPSIVLQTIGGFVARGRAAQAAVDELLAPQPRRRARDRNVSARSRGQVRRGQVRA
jgi:hypothetical protein